MWHRTENCKVLRDKVRKLCYNFLVFGELPKRFKGAHSKCVRPGDRCVGSNPMLSAKKKSCREAFSAALFVSCVVSTSQSRTCRSLGEVRTDSLAEKRIQVLFRFVAERGVCFLVAACLPSWKLRRSVLE